MESVQLIGLRQEVKPSAEAAAGFLRKCMCTCAGNPVTYMQITRQGDRVGGRDTRKKGLGSHRASLVFHKVPPERTPLFSVMERKGRGNGEDEATKHAAECASDVCCSYFH